MQALIARDHDLQQLGLGLVGPAARPPPSWQQRQEAFENYLRLIYGPDLLVSEGLPPAPPFALGLWHCPSAPPSLPGHVLWTRVPAMEHHDCHGGERHMGCVCPAWSLTGWRLRRSPNSANSPATPGPGHPGPALCPPSPSHLAHPPHPPEGAQQSIPGEATPPSHLPPLPRGPCPPPRSDSLSRLSCWPAPP